MSTLCNKATNAVSFTDKCTITTGGTNWQTPQKTYNPQYGWECPRCGRINAPWAGQCSCSRNTYTITSTNTIPSNSINWNQVGFSTPTSYSIKTMEEETK